MAEEILKWMRENQRPEGYELNELSARFRAAPERMRDQLRRLVDQGHLTQSEPVTGMSDANPTYQFVNRG